MSTSADEASENAALEERFVLFFDFLGASNAARYWPRERVHQFINLLVDVSQTESAEDMSGERQADGSYRIKVTPEVTTFSDNVVVSYRRPSDEFPRPLDSMWAEIVCKDAIRVLAPVAEMALRIGLLIRGGLSLGQLYHQGGVVFGEAFVDAYALEQELAISPRILVSDRVIAKLTHTRPEDMPDLLLADADGRWHLNYFTAMMRNLAPPGPDAGERAARWKRSHLVTIDHELEQHRRAADPEATNRVAKWEWFKERFEAATTRISG